MRPRQSHITHPVISTTLMLLVILLPTGSVTVAQTPNPPPCLQFGECELVTCNPDGSYTYTFAITNVGAFAATELEIRNITPAGVNISVNPQTLTPPLPPNWTRQITVTIGPGVPAGTSVCFTASVHDREDLNCCSSIRKCIILPPCGRQAVACASGVCCGGVPRIHDESFFPFMGRRLAVTTSHATIPTYSGAPAIQSEAVVRIVDITESIFILNGNVNAPMYYGPPNDQWTHKTLGTVFGITLDNLGNIFVTATSAYNGDRYPAPGTYPSGTIWRLDANTGIPSVFAQLPNFADPALAALNYPTVETFPALGDVSYDCHFQQFFVSNLEDGKIYRLKGNANNATGTVASVFDPFTADPATVLNPQKGFAPLGERVLAVEVHNGRVYYSRWSEDCGNKGSLDNEIWSIGLNSSGDFNNASDNRLELKLPTLPGQNFSNPVFDISFSAAGNMLLGERTMRCNPFGDATLPLQAHCGSGTDPYAAATLAAAHASRVLEFACDSDPDNPWKITDKFGSLVYRFNVGNMLNVPNQCSNGSNTLATNAAGGVDYDYWNGTTYTVWATGDSLLPYLPASTALVPYGLQGFLPTGGGMTVPNGSTNAVAIDLNKIMLNSPNQFADKAQIGDIEIICPAK